MYTIKYHHDIPSDIKSLDSTDRRRIQNAIETKLLQSPVQFGKPLQNSLRSLRTMRVGDYRVIFSLNKNELFVVLIAHRSVVYNRVNKRTK